MMSIEAQTALALATDARRRMAQRAASPPWYAPLYGLGMGGMVASFALPERLIVLGATGCTLGVLVLYSIWQRRTGLNVSGYRRGRTMPITVALLVCVLGLAAAAVVLRFRFGIGWAPVACGAVTAIVAGYASAVFDRVWRAEKDDLA
ncbi:hypothetical protein OKW76_09465 [Sphingomonas sp. S1-29]|uniref:hypothetical protein n=1 Tax=Sphingomonas sp. S1-29 TaxID=2991074 RepID=UPI00223F4389|nr:hypothetical protein [Sphingomonas sp. S1-29]UZK68300.1 hypothetical protein OKW76_09465 [Sphingomonas sp. S1-29]